MNQQVALAARENSWRARFSADEFQQIFDAAGHLEIRLELVDGELARMAPPNGSHSSRQSELFAGLWRLFGKRTMVETPIQLDDGTVLVCDVAVLYKPMAEKRFVRSDEVFLAVEVAESSVTRDLGLKRTRYAAVGIPFYWVVDGERRAVHRFGEPTDGEYLSLASLRFGEPVPVPGSEESICFD